MSQTESVVLIGSNKDSKSNIKKALILLTKQVHIISESELYEFECIKDPTNPKYLNKAILIRSVMSEVQLNNSLKEIESILGKVKTNEYCSIDLDLIYLLRQDLSIALDIKGAYLEPHIVIPISEILPKTVAPKTNQTFLELASHLKKDTIFVN